MDWVGYTSSLVTLLHTNPIDFSDSTTIFTLTLLISFCFCLQGCQVSECQLQMILSQFPPPPTAIFLCQCAAEWHFPFKYEYGVEPQPRTLLMYLQHGFDPSSEHVSATFLNKSCCSSSECIKLQLMS